MKIVPEIDAKAGILKIDGQLNITTAAQVTEAVNKLLLSIKKSNRKAFILEISEKSQITSSGIKLIFEMHASCVREGIKFGILNSAEAVKSVFKLAGLDNYMPIHSSRDSLEKSLV